MENQDSNTKNEGKEPTTPKSRGFGFRGRVLMAATLYVAYHFASGERLGITDALYEAGINFIDKHPKIGKSRIGKGIRKRLLGRLFANAIEDGVRKSPRRYFREDLSQPQIVEFIDIDRDEEDRKRYGRYKELDNLAQANLRQGELYS